MQRCKTTSRTPPVLACVCSGRLSVFSTLRKHRSNALAAVQRQIRHWTNPSFGGYGERDECQGDRYAKSRRAGSQGNAVRDAMRHLGMPEVRSVRIGKYMEIEIEGQDGELESRLHQLCRDLLSNPVIEDYELQRTDVDFRRQKSEIRRKRPTPINACRRPTPKRKTKSQRKTL